MRRSIYLICNRIQKYKIIPELPYFLIIKIGFRRENATRLHRNEKKPDPMPEQPLFPFNTICCALPVPFRISIQHADGIQPVGACLQYAVRSGYRHIRPHKMATRRRQPRNDLATYENPPFPPGFIQVVPSRFPIHPSRQKAIRCLLPGIPAVRAASHVPFLLF